MLQLFKYLETGRKLLETGRKLYEIVITYQDHVPDNSFQSFNLHYVNPSQSGNFAADPEFVASTWSKGGSLVRQGMLTQDAKTKMSLDYNYLGPGVHNLQIRIYSGTPTNNWLPYND
ncbi:hypothetical protein L5515_002489 [Caenorhabditis briggsae]|uniref:DUF7154 domain-containing protein n=1 Tax=Caenorhabditis briggsae TaxID=6238 RepID=A0AAE9DZ74_CAEBR|nr:hypothetical protein L3Y34_016418 [Caenorhabditis briggsae]UMM14827.1 hypothetical protein L5515_002489 [Caenorhabditis briggsae]